jgi:hypothetical protein
MKNADVHSPIEVFSGSFWEAGIVKNLLENADIAAFMKDEIIGSTAPWLGSSGGIGAVKIVVSGRDYDKAITIVEGYATKVCSDNNH